MLITNQLKMENIILLFTCLFGLYLHAKNVCKRETFYYLDYIVFVMLSLSGVYAIVQLIINVIF